MSNNHFLSRIHNKFVKKHKIIYFVHPIQEKFGINHLSIFRIVTINFFIRLFFIESNTNPIF